jgi:predicted nucleic acid-binding protein
VIAYLDTSAFIPLVLAEPTSAECRRLWDDADSVVTSRLLYVESAAALAQARRLDRITDDHHGRAIEAAERLWTQVDVIELDGELASQAAALAASHSLRGYDAVHCASALAVQDADLVAAAGDRRLLGAWHALGIATFDTHQSPPS